MSSLSVKLTIHLLSICHSLSLVSHRLYDLTPAPYLHKDQYKLPQYLGYLDKPVNVYRDTNDITDQTELTDAIRTQDQDRLVSLPYRSPFYGPSVQSAGRSLYSRKLELDYFNNYIARGSLAPSIPPTYQYNVWAVPECAGTNRHFYNISFCLEDTFYPVDAIKFELDRNKQVVTSLLSDISYQSADNLVDGLTKYQEENYNYYKGYKASPEFSSDGGYVCPADIFYGRPKRGQNTFGEWKVIVNLPDSYYRSDQGGQYQKYTQTTRLEQCVHPGAACSFISPGHVSSCLQKHNFVRLLAYTFDKGLHIDSFKLPVACSCHVSPGYAPPPPSPPPRYLPVTVSTRSPLPPAPTHLPPMVSSSPSHLPALINTPLYRPVTPSSPPSPSPSASPSSPNPYKVNLG